MSDMGDGGQTAAPQQEAPQEQSAPDPVMARLDEMAQQMSKLTAPQQPEQQWQGGLSDMAYTDHNQFEPQEPDTGFGGPQDPFADPYAQQAYDPQAEQQAMQQLEALINQRVEAATGPVLSQYQQMVVGQKAQALEQKYPQLADPKFVGPLMERVAREAQRLGRPEDARNPDFVELVHLAETARNSAAQETPADGGQGVHLESGGAAPQQEEMDAADRMLKAWNKL